VKAATILLLGVAAFAGFAFVGQRKPDPAGAPEYVVSQFDDGTWGYAARSNATGAEKTDFPFASEAAARAAALAWLASQSQQGGVQPPIVPPIPQAPYLRVTGGGITGEAFASATGVRWVVRNAAGVSQDGQAANGTAGSDAMLGMFGAATLGSPPATLELRRADGRIVRARVSAASPGYAWSTFTPAAPGGVSTSATRPEWRSLSYVGALRGALSTLQGM
jgi:hypothetical protein